MASNTFPFRVPGISDQSLRSRYLKNRLSLHALTWELINLSHFQWWASIG